MRNKLTGRKELRFGSKLAMEKKLTLEEEAIKAVYDQFRKANPKKMKSYAEEHGFIFKSDYPTRELEVQLKNYVFKEKDDYGREIILPVPLDAFSPDYGLRVRDYIKTVSGILDKTEREVLDNIL